MKKLILFLIAVVIVIGISFYLLHPHKIKPSVNSNAVSSQLLTVSSQGGVSGVLVDDAILPVNGYVVVRGVTGTRLSQIVDTSLYLTMGEHKNIQIDFSPLDTITPGDDLIVMIYADNGDQSFTGLTMPYKDTQGHMVAVYVKNGKPVPDSITEPTVATDSMGMSTAMVHYTNKGFTPFELTVPVGTEVTFMNESDNKMWVASDPHPEHTILPTFDEFEGVAKGGSYTYTFDKKGRWPYHDHVHAKGTQGIINVK